MKHNVAITQRNVKLAAQVQDHVAAWLRPPGFQEAEMPLGDARVERKRELAEAAALTPLPQQEPDTVRMRFHPAIVTDTTQRDYYLQGNRHKTIAAR